MTLAKLRDRVLRRLGEDPAATNYYSAADADAKINEGLRLFALLTLYVEKTATFTLVQGETWRHLRVTAADFLVPLRVRIIGGDRLRPARLAELDALKNNWQKNQGAPKRYALLGDDLLAITPQADDGATSLELTYAADATTLTADGDVPGIPTARHPDLADYAVHVLRVREGGIEFAKTRPLMERFLESANETAVDVRSRNKSLSYDTMPLELTLVDRSRLFGESRSNGNLQRGNNRSGSRPGA